MTKWWESASAYQAPTVVNGVATTDVPNAADMRPMEWWEDSGAYKNQGVLDKISHALENVYSSVPNDISDKARSALGATGQSYDLIDNPVTRGLGQAGAGAVAGLDEIVGRGIGLVNQDAADWWRENLTNRALSAQQQLAPAKDAGAVALGTQSLANLGGMLSTFAIGGAETKAAQGLMESASALTKAEMLANALKSPASKVAAFGGIDTAGAQAAALEQQGHPVDDAQLAQMAAANYAAFLAPAGSGNLSKLASSALGAASGAGGQYIMDKASGVDSGIPGYATNIGLGAGFGLLMGGTPLAQGLRLSAELAKAHGLDAAPKARAQDVATTEAKTPPDNYAERWRKARAELAETVQNTPNFDLAKSGELLWNVADKYGIKVSDLENAELGDIPTLAPTEVTAKAQKPRARVNPDTHEIELLNPSEPERAETAPTKPATKAPEPPPEPIAAETEAPPAPNPRTASVVDTEAPRAISPDEPVVDPELDALLFRHNQRLQASGEPPLKSVRELNVDDLTPAERALFEQATKKTAGRAILPDDNVTLGLTGAGQRTGAFSHGESSQKTLPDIFRDIEPDYTVARSDDVARRASMPADTAWEVTTPEGNKATVYQKGKEVWINVADLKEGQGGSRIYNAVANYAHNNDKVFIGDPDGLSNVAVKRRAETMLSSAIKHGTTDHLQPHDRQLQDHPELGYSKLDWRPGNTAHNIRELARVTSDATEKEFPELSGIRYNEDSLRFERPNGKEVTDADFKAIAATAREGRAGGNPGASGQGQDGLVRPAPTAGVRTLKRAVIAKQLASPEGEGLAKLLAGIGGRGAQHTAGKSLPQLEGLFYSKEGRAGGDPSVMEGRTHEEQAAAVEAAARKAWGRRLFQKTADRGNLQFIDSQKAVDLGLAKDVDEMHGVQGLYDPDTRAAYVITDQVHPSKVGGVVLHELGTHGGVREITGAKAFDRIVNRLRDLRDNGDPDVIRAYEAVPKDTPRARVDEEALAYLNEHTPGHDLITKLNDAVRRGLHNLGLRSDFLESHTDAIRRMTRENLRNFGRGKGVQRFMAPRVAAKAALASKDTGREKNAKPVDLAVERQERETIKAGKVTPTERAKIKRSAIRAGVSAEKADALIKQAADIRRNFPPSKGWAPKNPQDRYQAMVSVTQEGAPTQEAVSAAQSEIHALLKDNPSVSVGRVKETLGLYGGDKEASFDVEFSADRGKFDENKFLATVAKVAKDNNQMDVGVSRVVRPNEVNANARPGVEIYFKDKKSLDDAMPILKKFTDNGVDGFTLAVDQRATAPNEYIGARLQYVPEISVRWDAALGQRLMKPGAMEQELKAQANKMARLAAEVSQMDGVADAIPFQYDTIVVGKENYADVIDRANQGANTDPGKGVWGGKSVRENVEAAIARIREGEPGGREGQVHSASVANDGEGPLFSRRSVEAAKQRAAQKRHEVSEIVDRQIEEHFWDHDTGRWEGWQGALRKQRANLQDKMIGWKYAQDEIEKQTGELIADASNVHRLETLMHGRTEERIKKLTDHHFKPFDAAMHRAGVTVDEVDKYMIARHAKERNQRIRELYEENPNFEAFDGVTPRELEDGYGSGMTDKEADDYLASVDREKMEPLAQRLDAITQNTRKALLDDGLITKGQYDAMEGMYEHYVPLRGTSEPQAPAGSNIGRGLDGRVRHVRNAFGRGLGNMAEHVVGNIFGDAMRAAITAEKARVGRGVLRMVLEHPNDALWKVEPVKTEKALNANGEVYERVAQDWNDPTVVGVKYKGQLYKIQVNDTEMAKALNNIGVEDIPTLLKASGAFNRYLSSMLTRYNPAFIPVNAMRDAIFGLTGLAVEHGAGTAARAAIHYSQAAAAAYRHAMDIPPTTKWDQHAMEFAERGGKTGYAHMPSVEDIQRKIGSGKLGSYNPRGARAVAKVIADAVGVANDTIENALRLSAYGTLREAGMSADKAAEYAKNLTVNFNRKGHYGGHWNSAILFFNASMQGAHRVSTIMQNKKAWGFLGSLAAAQSAAVMYAMSQTDENGEPIANKVPSWVKQRNLWFTWLDKGGEQHLLTVPMPYGFNLFTYGAGEVSQALMNGVQGRDRREDEVGSIVGRMASTAVQSFSPVPLDDGALGILPPVVRIPTEVALNRNSWGNEIHRENPYSRHDIPLSTMGKPDTIELFKITAKGLNRLGGGDDYTPPSMSAFDWAPEDFEYLTKQLGGGAGKFIVDVATYGQKLATGAPTTSRDVPVASRFVSNVDEQAAQASLYYDRRDAIDRESDRLRDTFENEGQDAAERLLRNTPALSGVDFKRYRRSTNGHRAGEIIVSNGRPQLVAKDGSAYAAYKEATKIMQEERNRIRNIYSNQPATWLLNPERDAKIREAEERIKEAQSKFNRLWNRDVVPANGLFSR